jgi:xylulose-5-phosphate/fructose-6-phosphate phosphoketolase
MAVTQTPGSVKVVALQENPLSSEEQRKMDAYWRAANYLSVGQIYLLANPLAARAVEDRAHQAAPAGPLGHDAGPEFHLRAFEPADQEIRSGRYLYCRARPRRPGLVANTYLEGTYSEFYPNIQQIRRRHEAPLQTIFVSRRDSQPRGAPETPGSIHEGGELGYSIAHANGAAFDNPDLLVCCVVGDGEAETGALAASWHSNKFLNPGARRRCPAHPALNGYKIANPHRARPNVGRANSCSFFPGYGYDPYFVEGREPDVMHPLMAGRSTP